MRSVIIFYYFMEDRFEGNGVKTFGQVSPRIGGGLVLRIVHESIEMPLDFSELPL